MNTRQVIVNLLLRSIGMDPLEHSRCILTKPAPNLGMGYDSRRHAERSDGMNAMEEIKKVLKYWEEGKTNPSTAKLTISGEVLDQAAVELAETERHQTAIEQYITELQHNREKVYI